MLVSVPAATKSQAAWRAPVLGGRASPPVAQSIGKSSVTGRPDWSTPTPGAAGRRYAVDGAGTDSERVGRHGRSAGAGRVCGGGDHRVRLLVPRPVGPGRPAVPAR